MSAWAKPGVRCVAIAGEGEWLMAGTDEPTDAPGPDGRIYTIVSVITRDGVAYLGLEGDIPGSYWEAYGFRPLAYPPQSLEHDVSLFKPAHAPAPVVERT